MEPKVPPQSIVIDLVIVTAPKPPGSVQLISPLAAVFEMAPAKGLHGAGRLHGLASSPTPDTAVRVACAWTGAASIRRIIDVARRRGDRDVFVMLPSQWRADRRRLECFIAPKRTTGSEDCPPEWYHFPKEGNVCSVDLRCAELNKGLPRNRTSSASTPACGRV